MTPRTDQQHWPSLTTLVIGLLSVGPVGIVAQTSTVVCLPSFDWMNNSRNQTPCIVSAYLQGVCNGGQYSVLPLPVSTHYIGPTAEQANECQCNSVTYDTISACGLCQNRTIISWSSWYTNCTSISDGFFPASIPDGTAVPAWAFQDVTTSDLFNATLAQSVGDSPESIASSTPSPFSVGASSTASASLTTSPSPSTSDTSNSSSGKNSNAGAIAGGVVGGVVGIALIAGIAFYFMRQRSRALSSAQGADQTEPAHLTSEMAQPKLYNPSDPSTFPTSPPITLTDVSLSNIQGSGISYPSHSVRSGYYGGAPEI